MDQIRRKRSVCVEFLNAFNATLGIAEELFFGERNSRGRTERISNVRRDVYYDALRSLAPLRYVGQVLAEPDLPEFLVLTRAFRHAARGIAYAANGNTESARGSCGGRRTFPKGLAEGRSSDYHFLSLSARRLTFPQRRW